MNPILAALAVVLTSSISMASPCSSRETLQLFCEDSGSSVYRSGDPTAVTVCYGDTGFNLIFEVKNSAKIVQLGVTKAQDNHTQHVTYSSLWGPFAIDVESEDGFSVAHIFKKGEALTALRCH